MKRTAATPHIPIPYARFRDRYMSAILAPPVARDGEPTKPVINRNARSMPKLVDRAVGICKMTKRARVEM